MGTNTVLYEILRNQWAVVALLGGIVLTITVILTYWALWRPREEEARKGRQEISDLRSLLTWIISFLPWVLALATIATMAYVIAYVAMAVFNSPNW